MNSDLPLIGVIACGREVEGEAAQIVKYRYLDAVAERARAVPLIVPSNQPADNVAAILARLDAVLLTGSNSNIAPGLYGSSADQRLPHDPHRDSFSAALILGAIAAAKPVFGVCRGLQEINVALGGSLVDLRETSAGGAAHHAPDGVSLEDMFAHRHAITATPGGMLQHFAKADRFEVNSVHYQAIDRLADGLAVDATGPDGVIEAISAPATSAPVFAVQWHPEWQPVTRPHDLEFWNFLGEAARSVYLPAPAAEPAP